jgi:integrase
MNLEKANEQFSKIKIIQIKQSLYAQGTFPPKKKHGTKPKQYQVPLKCKATAEGLKIAIAKAKAIESALLLEKWEWEEDDKTKLTVEEAIKQYVEYYWTKNPQTESKLYYHKIHRERIFNYLPEDRIFDKKVTEEGILSFPAGSYPRNEFITYIRPVAKYHNIEIDYAQYGKYEKRAKILPLLEDIINSYQCCTKKQYRIKWIIGILFTFGLRPHEIYRSEFLFNRGKDIKTGKKLPNIVLVGEETKTKQRTVYPLTHPAINVFELEIPTFNVNLNAPNTRLGHLISEKFIQFPFTAYQLRHYYAVRGAMEGISPVTMSKWMGHSLNEHFKSYASLLGDIESEAIWLDKFSK